jgi:hypothetical protein
MKKILFTLGLPVALAALFGAVLLMFGIELDLVLKIAGSMLGLQALFAVIIDILKKTGQVLDNTAQWWSAAFNLAAIVGVSVALILDPAFDFPKWDSIFSAIAQIIALGVAIVSQFVGTQQIHFFLTRGIGLRKLSFTMMMP